MSLESWKAIYFSTPIKDATFTEQSAVEHCLRKWRGLRPKVLKQHQIVFRSNYDLWQLDSAESCALCVRHAENCSECSLSLSRNGFPCTRKRYLEKTSPWGDWVDNSDPEPMIQALEHALKFVKKEGL